VGRRHYQPEAAHQAALLARARPRESKLTRNRRLRRWVQDRLDERYSPEQIAGRLRVAFPGREEMRISHETIYRAIYVRPRGELRRELRAHLRTGRGIRKRRNARQPRETRGQIVGMVSIHERPEEIEARLVPGDYEGDLLVGPNGTTAAIGTLVERFSGHVTAFQVPAKTTQATIAGLTAAVTRTGWPMKTLTWDRGKEMGGHARFTIDTGIQVYFADPHAPWQRGSNENTNGLLREYFPKGLDLTTVTNDDLQAAVDQLNNRPRKRHGFLTPNEVLAGILAEDQTNPGVATAP
jgi:IS30 family transposase